MMQKVVTVKDELMVQIEVLFLGKDRIGFLVEVYGQISPKGE